MPSGFAPLVRRPAEGTADRPPTRVAAVAPTNDHERAAAPSTALSLDFSRVPAGGTPLPKAVRVALRRTTGREPETSVRVHTDAEARATADAFGARAVTFAGSIRLGSSASLSDIALLVHEGVHAIQQGPVRASG